MKPLSQQIADLEKALLDAQIRGCTNANEALRANAKARSLQGAMETAIWALHAIVSAADGFDIGHAEPPSAETVKRVALGAAETLRSSLIANRLI